MNLILKTLTACILIAISCADVGQCSAMADASYGQRVRLTIRAPRVFVDHREIRVKDIAELSGGNQRTREEMAILDLDSVNRLSSVNIDRNQITMRLLIAGFTREQFEVYGPTQTDVSFGSEADLKRLVEDRIAGDLSQQFGIEATDVQVTLLDANVLGRLRTTLNSATLRTLSVFPAKIPLGEKNIQVEFSDAAGGRINLRVPLRIVVMKKVVVSASALRRGTVIAAHHIQSVRRPLIDNSIELASMECVGCEVTRDIGPHEIVSTRYLKKPDPADLQLVKRNDIVDIVLVRGRLSIRLKNAKVITAGAKGEIVQVLNPASGKPITAVVESKSIVKVQQ